MLAPALAVTSRSPFKAHEIATPMEGAEEVLLREDPQSAYDRLVAHDFDQAPVVDRGHVVGWVTTKSLEGLTRIRGALQDLPQTALVAEDAPVDVALAAVARRRFAFTIGDNGITGFITPADLDKHALRGHFFLLVSAVEMLLSEVVERSCRDGAVMEKINSNEDTQQRWNAAKEARLDLRPVEYLYLQDLATLFCEGPANEHDRWTKQLEDQLTKLCHLRTRVMHPTRPLLGRENPRSLAAVAEAAKEVIEVLSQIAKSSENG